LHTIKGLYLSISANFDIFEIKYLMRFQFLFIILLGSYTLFSQGTDQVIQAYENGNTDEKIEILFANYGEIESISKDTILFFIRDLQSIGIEKEREDAIALSNYYFGHFLNDNTLYSEAYNKLSEAIKFYKFEENDTMLAASFNALGNTDYLKGDYGSAEENYLKSYDYGKLSGTDKFQTLSSANLSRIYIYKEDYNRAKEILNDYIEFNKSVSNIRNVGTGYGIYGQLYINQNKLEEAIEYLDRSMEFNLSTGNSKLIGNGYTNIAIASFIKEDFRRAEEYFQLALSYRIEGKDHFFIAESYFNLGDFYFATNELDSALVFYNKSFDIASEHENKIGMVDALEQISQVHEGQGQFKLQAKSLKEYIQLQKEINSEKMSQELSVLRISFEEDLEQQSFVGHRREEKLRGQIADVSTLWDSWVWIVLVGLLTLSGIVYFSFTKKKR
jgi:tetratricopeptide (TPR) repeat protein